MKTVIAIAQMGNDLLRRDMKRQYVYCPEHMAKDNHQQRMFFDVFVGA